MNAVGPFFPTMITIRYIEIEWWDFNNLFLCFLRKERINRNVILHLGKIEEKEYYLDSPFFASPIMSPSASDMRYVLSLVMMKC